jgi:hypothetical protein
LEREVAVDDVEAEVELERERIGYEETTFFKVFNVDEREREEVGAEEGEVEEIAEELTPEEEVV